MVVVWSKLAEAELKKVHKYISLDSPKNARKIVHEIVDATIGLANHPEKYSPDKYKLNNDGNWRALSFTTTG
jgi:plasmid stabilization system protein ParE